jgi:hypothetical protein
MKLRIFGGSVGGSKGFRVFGRGIASLEGRFCRFADLVGVASLRFFVLAPVIRGLFLI